MRHRHSEKRAYHHGNLAESLLNAVDELATQFGLEAVTLRGCAKLIGVSPSSAFRHYADKRALLTAFATRALHQLADTMSEARHRAHREETDAFCAVGLAYIEFALEKPALFATRCVVEMIERFVAQTDKRLMFVLSFSGPSMVRELGGQVGYYQPFVDWLSGKEGEVYRLPTDAEWAYACRAGTTTRFYFGDREADLSDFEWWGGNSGGSPHPVGQKRPNPWQLHDMLRNVWELCNDWYDPEYFAASPEEDPQGPEKGTTRVIRGGASNSGPIYVRYSERFVGDPKKGNSVVGFRCVLGDL